MCFGIIFESEFANFADCYGVKWWVVLENYMPEFERFLSESLGAEVLESETYKRWLKEKQDADFDRYLDGEKEW